MLSTKSNEEALLSVSEDVGVLSRANVRNEALYLFHGARHPSMSVL